MNARPDATTLLRAAVIFLRDEAMPKLDPALRFDLRVTINALELVCRELEGGQIATEREITGLIELGFDAPQVHKQREALCRHIRQGEGGIEKKVLQHLLEVTLDQLAIDQPGYSGIRDRVKV